LRSNDFSSLSLSNHLLSRNKTIIPVFVEFLRLRPRQGNGIDFNLNDKHLHSFMERLINSSSRAEWDLEFRLPVLESTISAVVSRC